MTRVSSPFGDMDPEAFRREAHRLVDWIADYLATSSRFPVLARVQPGEISAALPADAPDHGEPFEKIFSDFERILLPGITHWNHPGFFAYFAITGSAPGILAEFLSAALNVQAMLWRTSPAATELEEVTLTWLRKLLTLPSSFEGVIYDTASISTLHALAAARERAVPSARELGLAGRDDVARLRVYCSDQTHSSIEKAAILLGLGQQAVRKIPSDGEFRMRVDLLAEAIADDRSKGWLPLAVVATVGTTSSTSVDPVPAIADIAERHGMWMHIDAAYGGAAGLLPSHRHLLDGCERADSLVFNPHKWLLTPVDCSLLFTSRPDVLRQAFSVVPFYLTSAEHDVTNLMDYGIALGRRFRALKLWFVLRAYGADGLREMIAGHIAMAQELAGWIDQADGWELLAPVPLSTVCFRRHPAGVDDEAELDRLNAVLVERVNAGGVAFVSHTQVGGRYAVRMAIGNGATGREHVRRAWDALN